MEWMLLFTANALLVALVGMVAWMARARGRDADAREALLHEWQARDLRAERAVREELAAARTETAGSLRGVREEVSEGMRGLRGELGDALKGTTDSLVKQLGALTTNNDARLEAVRGVIAGGLASMSQENAKKLEEMRATVDEKLSSTLHTRLGESFQRVSEELKRVYEGLGEMKTLALGVGDLKKVLTNVKTRGTWGELLLGQLLEQLLAPEQFAKNVMTRPGSGERVEFAVRLPGREGDGSVWLPIDAKFPQEDYQRLLDAAERADAAGVEAAGKALEARVKGCAKDISTKYVEAPHTTDFAILYLPVEGLFAEVVRRPGLLEALQRDFRVMVAGPTTLAALLNSLQMGFRTLAIQKRSSEVWALLGTVKTEFNRFGLLLDGVQKKLQQASATVEDAARKSRTIERKLKGVESAPGVTPAATLPGLPPLDLDEDPGMARPF